MEAKQIALKFLEKKYQLNMGAGKLAKLYNVSKEIIYEAKTLSRKEIEFKLPKILILDIETAPLKGYVWKLWKEDVGFERLISDWFMLTWSAKWLFEPVTHSMRLTGKEVLKEDDSRIVKELWKLLDDADIVITHNGEQFDLPKINSRFIINKLLPVSPYKSIDTKRIASKQFGFSSNKLDALALHFGFEPKLDTTFTLWKKCMEGDEVSLKYMETYNKHDVELLEEVYLKLRPWIQGHPNIGLYLESDTCTCTNCGSNNLTYLNKYYYTSTGKFELYRCSCGAIVRRRLNAFNTEKKENLLIPIQ